MKPSLFHLKKFKFFIAAVGEPSGKVTNERNEKLVDKLNKQQQKYNKKYYFLCFSINYI